jgi:GT2 family glycosyltransferase
MAIPRHVFCSFSTVIFLLKKVPTMNALDQRVSVSVLTYNRRSEVCRCLQELRKLPERPHLLVVDNGSTDGTTETIHTEFPDVQILTMGKNLGAAGRTAGVRAAPVPYVALSDDDTWWEPGSLRLAADLLDAHPRLAIVTARVLVGPTQREDPTCALMARSPLPREPEMPGPPILGFLAGASVVRRSAFLQAGGFEPRLFLGGEEELLATDLTSNGWWLCYVPELLVHHYPSPARDGVTRRGHLLRNALWCTWLRRPLSGALRRTLRLACSVPWDGVAVKGFVGALAGLPWVLQQRRVVPRRVEKCLCLLETSR